MTYTIENSDPSGPRCLLKLKQQQLELCITANKKYIYFKISMWPSLQNTTPNIVHMGCPLGGLLELACEPKVGAPLGSFHDLPPFLLNFLVVVVADLKVVFLPDALPVAAAVFADFFLFCFPCKDRTVISFNFIITSYFIWLW